MSENDRENIHVMTAAEQANFRSVMKSTEELVTKARLDQIARENKSMGAILDNRVLYKIEEPKKHIKSQTFKTALQLQREKELAEEEQAKVAQHEQLKVREADLLKKQNDYSTEQQIWKEKSGPSTYSQTRRFQFPELQKFKDNMTHEQQKQFKRRTTAALMALADKYREECKEMKIDMDLNGVFHPEANAHRIHCIYLMKLYKGIRSDAIEDPILKQMKAEEEQKQMQLKLIADQKKELLRSMEEADLAKMTPAQKEEAQINAESIKAEKLKTEQTNTSESVTSENESMDINIVNTTNVSVLTSTPKHTTAITPIPSKNNVQFSRMNSMKSNASASGKSVSHTNTSSKRQTPTTAGRSAKNVGFDNTSATGGSGCSSKSSVGAGSPTHKTALNSKNTGDSTTAESAAAVKAGKGLSKSVSLPAVGAAAGAGVAKSVTTTTSTVATVDRKHSSSKPTKEADGTGSALSRRPMHSKSTPALHNNNSSGNAAAISSRRRVLNGISEDMAEHSSLATSLDHSTDKDRSTLSHAKHPDKLFKKIKNNRLGGGGGVDSKLLLSEEAHKLESAESFQLKKTRDKSSLLETKMPDWMPNTIQKTQINKINTGTNMLTSDSLSQSSSDHILANSIVTDFNDAIKQTKASPVKMLNFEDFYAAFNEYNVNNTNNNSTAMNMEPLGSVTMKSPVDVTAKKNRRRRATDGSIAPEGGSSSSVSVLEDENSINFTTKTRNSNILLTNITTATATTNAVEPSNLIKTLAEKDKNFEAYLKLAQHQGDPSGSNESGHMDKQALMRQKLNASIAAPKRMRKHNPLGQRAVNLVDSRGRARKDAQKGFGNIFQTKTNNNELAVADAAVSDTRKPTIRIDSHVNIVGTDNIMNRLSKFDEEDNYSRTSGVSFEPHTAPSSPGSPASFRPGSSNIGDNEVHSNSNNNFSEKERMGRSSRSRSRRRMISSRDTAVSSSKSGKLCEEQEEEGEGVIAEVGPDQGVQDKLLAAWECLQMPAAQRYAFMHKYSTDEYSMEMGRAVDMWGQCALLVVCAVELNKTLAKLKAGTFIPPLSKNYVLRSIRNKVPPLLASASSFFVPPSLGYYAAGTTQQSIPLSAEALQKTQDIIHGFFQQYNESNKGLNVKNEIFDLLQCMNIMNSIFAEVATLLKKALKFTYMELADVIPYGGRGCKEWIFSLTGMGAKRMVSQAQLSSASFDEEDLI